MEFVLIIAFVGIVVLLWSLTSDQGTSYGTREDNDERGLFL